MPKSTGKPTNLNKHFKIFTPKRYILPTKDEVAQLKKKAEEDKIAKEEQETDKKKKKGEVADEEEYVDPTPWIIRYDAKTSVSNMTRWKIPAKRTVRLFIKYFSKVKTQQNTRATFESLFSNGKNVTV
jgi:hypothetical protein